MRKALLLFFLSYPCLLFPQSKSDIGVLGGGTYYMGDINPSTPFYSPGYNFGVNYRYNINSRYVLKGEMNYLTLSANDANFTDSYQRARGMSFASKIIDYAAQFEFNFLPIKFVERKVFFSPFVSAGLGVAQVLNATGLSSIGSIGSSTPKTINFVVPFSLGARISLGEKWSVGFEWNMRKTFTDNLDGVQNMIAPSMRSIFNNNDWYYFYGLFFTYKIFEFPGECPAYGIDH